MSTTTRKDEEDEIPQLERPPSPQLHTTFAARGVLIPTFSAFRPRDIRITSPQAMSHVAWSADGKKLAAVGIDKIVRIFQPDKSMEMRSASLYSGAHADEVDYVTWHPMHPELFCSSSQRDRRITFWDARHSRHIQQIALKASPVQTAYSPNGRYLVYVTASHSVFSMEYSRQGEETKDSWHLTDRDAMTGSTATFNHAGDAIVLTHQNEHSLRIVDFPSLAQRETVAAHVGGCTGVALDPRGRYLASGGHDSIVNIFDTSEWICARTITACDNAITALSFSYDGEFLAIANQGTYIDICATETGVPLHRVPALASSSTVAWHPWKHAIAYCGQTKAREGGPPAAAVLSLFGAT